MSRTFDTDLPAGGELVHHTTDEPGDKPDAITRLYEEDGDPWAAVEWSAASGNVAFANDQALNELLPVN
ncbi:hypothetical protein ACIA78_21670 [Streptomyces xanthochromogenes]|uniref:hypothetical protein n=1 Tax=Streptomyces xanthochromogenes TaxID=67384 RepID=UPI0037B559D3